MTAGQSARALAMTALVVVAAFAPVVGPVGSASAQSGSVTTVDDCQTLDSPGPYVLTTDIDTYGSSNCIQITSDDVSLDGNGHVIRYIGSGAGPSAISVSGDSVGVRNVTIRYFSTGVKFTDADNGEISNVVVEPETSSDDPGANGNGIALYSGSDNNLVQNNVIDRPGQRGDVGQEGNGIYVSDSHDNVLDGNDIYDPADVGIRLEGSRRTTLTGNDVRGNQFASQRYPKNGIRLDGGSNQSVLQGNDVYGASSPGTWAMQYGIYVASDGNALSGNEVSSTYYSGIVVYGQDNALDGNHVTGNVEHGIEIKSSSVDLTNNVVIGNGLSGIYLDGTGSGTVRNNTAYGNSGWDVELVDTAGLDAENTALSSGGPGVTLRAISASIRGVGSRETPAGMDDVGQFFNVSGSPTVDVSYTDAAAAGVAEENLTLWGHDGSSWTNAGGTVDVTANVVTGSVGSGVYAPLANDTRTPNISKFDATSPAHRELEVTFDSDESLETVEVAVQNESGTVRTLTRADFAESGFGALTYTGTATLQPGPYDVTLLEAADGAGNDGANGQTGDALVTAGLGITASVPDQREDGHVVDGETVELTADVTGYDIQSVTSDASTLGVGSVELQDPDGDGTYARTVTVDAANGTSGVHSIQFTATDGSGQVVTDSVSLDLDVRTPGLNIESVSVRGGGITVTDGDIVDVSLTATDRNGVDAVDLDATNFGGGIVALENVDGDVYEGSFTVSVADSVGDGYHWITVTATDMPGNVREGNVGRLSLDSGDADGPTLTTVTATNLDGPDDDVGDGHRIEVAVTATDDLGVDTVTADGSAFGVGSIQLVDGDGDDVYTGTFTVDAASADPDGTYGIPVEATDLAGNTRTATTNPLSLVTDRDLTPPAVTALSVTDPFDDDVVTDGNVVDVQVTVTDAGSGVASVEADASSFGAGTLVLDDPEGDDVYEGSFTVDADNAEPDGWHSLSIAAEDGDGNVATEQRTLELDRSLADDVTPPTVHEFTVIDGVNDRIAVEINASESLAQMGVTIRSETGAHVATLDSDAFDGGSYGDSHRYVASHAVAESGTYEVTLDDAVDRAGNDGASGETATVEKDTSDDPGDGGPVIAVDPAEYDFGRIQVDDSDPVTIMVRNEGTEPLDVSNVRMVGVPEERYQFDVVDEDPFVLAPGEFRGVTVEFAPYLTGPASASLAIVSNDSDATTTYVPLSGTATEENPISVTVDGQIRESDGTVAAGDVVALVDADSLYTEASVRTDANGDFSIDAPKGPTYWVVYVQLNESAPSLTLGPVDGSPDLFTLGSTADNETITRTLPTAHATNVTVIRGDTGAPVADASTYLAHEEASLMDQFPGATDDQGRLVVDGLKPEPGIETVGTLHIGVRPPTGSGLATNVTNVSVSGPTEAVVVLDPDNGTIDEPDVSLSAAAVDFGDVSVDTTVEKNLTVANQGTAPLAVTGVSLGGANADQFGVAVDPVALDPGAVGNVTITFVPTSQGAKTATLTLASNDSDEPGVVVPLSGVGLAAPSPGPPTSSGGGSSGGGSSNAGGPGSATPPSQSTRVGVNDSGTGQVDVSVRDANAGTNVTIDTANHSSGDVSLDGLDVTPLIDGDFTLNVSVSETAPPGAPADAPTADAPIAYLNVDHSIADDDIGEVTFRVRVSKAALADRGLAPDDVVVYRYHDGQWGAASMNVSGETADEYVLAATVPGLSVFAVGSTSPATTAETDTEVATPTETATQTETATPGGAAPPSEPADESSFPTAVMLGVLVLLALGGALIGFRR